MRTIRSNSDSAMTKGYVYENDMTISNNDDDLYDLVDNDNDDVILFR